MPRIFVSDFVVVNQVFLDGIGAEPGEEIQIGSEVIILEQLSPKYNYVFACVKMKISGDGTFYLKGENENPRVSVCILANRIAGPLNITCRGINGTQGRQGDDWEPVPTPEYPYEPDLGFGVVGHRGGKGGTGNPGLQGGSVVITYNEANITPTGLAPGGTRGSGGRGGRGGIGGTPRPSQRIVGTGGPPGFIGDDGSDGPDGTVAINLQPSIDAINSQIPSGLADRWRVIRPSLCSD